MSNDTLEKIKQKYPRAYEKWTQEEDTLLLEKHKQGMRPKEIAQILQRQPSAIRSRLLKSEITYQGQDLGKGTIEVAFAFEWESVLQDIEMPYAFPNAITDFMRKNYKKPAIYRWVIDHGETDEQTFYIGEAVRLCPDRLSGYLSPGPTQQTFV